MPAIGQQTRPGDPTVQVSGQHRGTVDVTFDDGRIVTMNYRAVDLADWNTKEAGASADAEDCADMTHKRTPLMKTQTYQIRLSVRQQRLIHWLASCATGTSSDHQRIHTATPRRWTTGV
jgi:hypothetical protein